MMIKLVYILGAIFIVGGIVSGILTPPRDNPPKECQLVHLEYTWKKGNYWVCDK